MNSATMPSVPAGLVMMLRGEPVRWRNLGLTRDEFFALCDREELRGLLFSRIGASESDDWPATIREELAQGAREETAREMLRRAEIASVLSALTVGGARPVVFKGTALAYSVYDTPVARPRLDTDILIDAAGQDAARRTLEDRGYAAPPYCDQLFSQFQMEKIDGFGVLHVFDVHWKISTQPVFQSVLTYDEMLSRAAPVPALGPQARAAGAVDALLLACIHPVMHHRNEQRVLWVYDIHLLAGRLSTHQVAEFTCLARQKQIAAICAHQLRVAQAVFQTALPPHAIADLSRPGDPEPSAAYLASHRRWHHELASSVRGTPRFGDRVTLLRNVLLPSPGYMLGAYGLRDKPLAAWLLPALYVHRNVRGAWKILTGKK